MLVAPPDTIVPEFPQQEEWINVTKHDIQIWFSQTSMFFYDALFYCNNLGGFVFEPYSLVVLEDVSKIARTAGLAKVWIGLSDEKDEKVYVMQHTIPVFHFNFFSSFLFLLTALLPFLLEMRWHLHTGQAINRQTMKIKIMSMSL